MPSSRSWAPERAGWLWTDRERMSRDQISEPRDGNLVVKRGRRHRLAGNLPAQQGGPGLEIALDDLRCRAYRDFAADPQVQLEHVGPEVRRRNAGRRAGAAEQ